MINAGFASVCITPPLGREIPGLFNKRFAEGVQDDLYARAAVLDDGVRLVALVQTDAIAMPDEVVAAARREARRLCGFPERNILIAATHTHSGGPVAGCLLAEADPEYLRQLSTAIGSAVAEAFRRQRPAYAATASAAAPGVAFNRRFRMKDGTQRAHPGKMNPDIVDATGPADPTVTVIAFRRPEEFRPFGCLVHFACHATHMNGLLYSADYPRWIVDTLRAVHGPDFGVVFLNGACGDVTQVDNRSPRPPEFGLHWCRRTGEAVGAAALQALSTADYWSDATVDTHAIFVRVPIRLVGAEQRAAAKALLAERPLTADDVETVYAREALLVDAMRRKLSFRRLEVQGIRVADTVLWSAPGELFQSFALEVQKKSAFPRTCCVELANGYAGYICTEEAFLGGGYETRTARSSYLVPEAGRLISRTAGRVCAVLHERARAELQALPASAAWIPGDDSALEGLKQAEKRRPPARART